ncbi:MAG: RpoL/Rpb11 RNA polymerase subunit family protein [Promethearchaeota archaeon]
MAKKKKKDLNEDLEDDFEISKDVSVESVYPNIKEPPAGEKPTRVEKEATTTEQIPEEQLEVGLEEEELEKPKYKYLDLRISKDPEYNNYELTIEGQSHGFCNLLVKHLLQTEGVISAAYKSTELEPSKLFIQIENNFDIKTILQKSIESFREEVVSAQKLFEQLFQ